MDRELLRAYLATEYDSLLAESSIAATDTAAGLGPVLDAVETLVTLAPTLSPLWERPLGRYYALSRIVNRLAVNMNVSVSGDSYALQQQFANAKTLLDRARIAVAWIVEPLPSTAGGGPGTVTVIETTHLTGGEYTTW